MNEPNAQLSETLQIISTAQSEALLTQALANPRKREHVLLHSDHDDAVQRLLVALELNTYIQPHRHAHQWEMIVPLRGILRLIVFSNDGVIENCIDIEAAKTAIVQIPTGLWHTVLPIEPALILETKPGPYRPAQFAPWAPNETDTELDEIRKWLKVAQIGSRLGEPI